MITELWPLLQRVEAAGGPVEVDGGYVLVFVRLDRREEVPLWTEDFGEYSDRKSVNEALLIHALRQDAMQRGGSIVHMCGPDFGHRVLIDQEIRLGVAAAEGRHELLDMAWLLAWLDAFEDKQEATP